MAAAAVAGWDVDKFFIDVEGGADDEINRLRKDVRNQRELQSQLTKIKKELKTNKIVSERAGVIDKHNNLHRAIQSRAGRNIGGDELLEVLRDDFCIR